MKNKHINAYTLVELLVVIAIIGILMGLSFFALASSRQAGRDAKRRADLESLRSGLEIYRTDCNVYPAPVSNQVPLPLAGNGTPGCEVSNTYISSTTYTDPVGSPRIYRYYYDAVANTYEICTYLEQGTGANQTCGGSNACGGVTCNYKVISP